MTGWGVRIRSAYDRAAVLAAALLVALGMLWNAPASAQTAQTVTDLLGGISIPGLDSLPISNLQITDSYKSADITVHGQTATLVVFKPTGSDKNVVGVVPNNFSIGDFVPLPSGTPLDDVTFSDMAFVIAQEKTSMAKADAPTPLSAALSHGDDTVTLKKGVNLFGEADFSASGTVKDLLSNVGITNLTLPLNGGLPANLFSQNPKTAAQAFKNQILDNLDIQLDLPTISIPGISKVVNIRQSVFAIKGVNKGGKRSIDINVGGELDVTVRDQTIAFDYDLKVVKESANKTKIELNGKSKPGDKLTVKLVETMNLSSLAFEATKSGDRWNWQITGDTKFRGKTVSATYQPGPTLTISTQMTLAEIAGHSDLPVLKDIKSKWVTIIPGTIRVAMTIKGTPAALDLWKPPGSSKYYAGFTLGDLSPANLIPGTENSPLRDATFKDLVFIHKPTEGTKAFARKDLPDEVGYRIPAIKGLYVLKNGLNVFGKMEITPTGEMANLLKQVGITDLNLPLNGTLSPKIFSKNISGAAIKNEILDALDLNIPLPKLDVPGVSKVANIRRSFLAIKGVNNGGKRSIDVKVAGELDVKVGSEEVVFDFGVEVKPRSGKKPEIIIAATEAPGKTIKIKMLEEFTLRELSFNMNNAQDRWVWEVSGDTEFRSRTVNVGYVNDPKAGKFMYVNAKMTLADIAGSSLGLPGLDDVILENIQVWNNKFVLETKVKGKSISLVSFKRPGFSKPYVSVQIGNISPADIIPGAENTPLKDVDFTNLSFLYSPASTARTASESNLVPNVAGWLKYAGSDVTIKPGLNVYGKMDIHPSGEMANLLNKVGITDLNLPLSGGFSKSAFGKHSTAAIKNAIMAALDLNMPLPTPNIPGLSSALTFSNGKLHIKGQLPDGTQGVSVSVAGDADVKFGSDSVDFAVDVTFDRATGGAEKELKVTGSTTTPWNDPFGMTWIDLTNLAVTFDENTTNGQKDWDVSVAAKSTIGRHSNLDVTVNVEEQNGALTDATFTLDGPLDLSEVPGIRDIPEVNDLTITSLTASGHGIDAKTTFQGRETDFFAFEDNAKWVIALSQNNFTLTEIVPPLSNTPLKNIVLSEAAIVVTQAQVSGALSSFGPIAIDAFDDIYQITAGSTLDPQISIPEGLNLIAAFEHGKSSGSMKEGMTKLGMKEERVILTGDIGGIMGNSNPHVNLKVALSQHGRPDNMPRWMNFADNTEIVFSIFGSDAGDDPVIEIGIGVDINTRIHDDNLTFAAKVGLEFQEEAAEVKFVMDLKNGNLTDGGTTDYGLNCSLTNTPGHSAPPGPAGWNQPFGIPGLSLYDVAMDIGVDEDGAIQLGFAGGAKIGGDRFCIAADVGLLPEAEGAPQDIAFVGAADLVKADFLENLAIQVATDLANGNSTTKGIVSKFPISDITTIMEGMPQPEYKNVKFAFVTPGASDPDLHIQGEGVALKGTMSWLGKTLGSVDMAVGPKTGIKIDGTIGPPKPDGTAGPLTIGPIDFRNTYLDFQIPMPPKNPLDGYFKLNADLTIPVVGVTEKIKADVTNKGMSLSVTNTILSDFSETLDLALTGVDLSVTHPSMSNADFAISGTLKADFATFIRKTLPKIVHGLTAELNKTLADGEKKIKADRTKVDGLTTKINNERAIVRAERAKVEAKLNTAQDRVNDIQGDIDHDWRKYHHCSRWDFWCKPRWGITIGVEKAAKEVADLVLEAVEDLVAHVPIDFDPRVWPLIAAKDAAVTALDIALASIEGLDDIANLANKALDKIDVFPGGAVNLKHASFNGDLKKIINSDAPVDLNIDLELFGADFSETFAFKLGDAANELENLGEEGAKDSAHLAILGYVAVDHLFNKVLKDIPEPFKRQLARHIGEKIHSTQVALKAELKTYKTDFLKYHKTAQALQLKYQGFSDSYSAALMQKRVTMLDKEPASKTFTDTQLELGATGLCLTDLTYIDGQYHNNIYNGCAAQGDENDEGSDISYSAQKISTENVLYTSGKNKGKATGYVKINAQGGKCLVVPGKWKFEEVTYGTTIVEQEVFNPFTRWGTNYGGKQTYGTPMFVDTQQCKDDPQFQWKVLAHGKDYFQLHNRATQTCMWMKSTDDGYGDYSNAMEMIPCAGADTSVFRIAKAAPAVFHEVGLPIKRGYGMKAQDGDYVQYPNAPATPECIGLRYKLEKYNRSRAYWGSCDKPFNYNQQTGESTAGYDTFDYFEDNLGRRRYVSKGAPGMCLYINNDPDNGGFHYFDCDSEDETQWMLATPVVGGLSLRTPGSQIQYNKLTLGDKFPDPMDIYYQPLNPRAGAKWTAPSNRSNGNELNAAYTGPEQATSAINARATEWAAIKTGLKAKSNDLAAGKQACVESGNKNYCYRLGPQTGYVTKTVPAGQTPTQLKDGAPILADDISDARVNKLANISPIAEPKWFLCANQSYVMNNGSNMYVPGVVVNQDLCYFSEGRIKNGGGGSRYTVKNGADIFWQPAGGGYLPAAPVITGRVNLNAANGVIDLSNLRTGQLLGSTMAAYSCRAMIGRKTKIGWTVGGEYCHILKLGGGAVVKNFEVLTLSRTIAAPPPPPPPPGPSCTFEKVQKYYDNYRDSNVAGTCTKRQYNREHPQCHFNSRANGYCGGGPPRNDPYGRRDEGNTWNF